MLNTTQAQALAQILRRANIDGARVARLLLGVATPRLGDYRLLSNAAFAASGSAAAEAVACDELYEILGAAALRVASEAGDPMEGYSSERVVALP